MTPDLELRVSESADDSWSKAISRCDGNVYHDPKWLAMQASRGGESLYFKWLDRQQQTVAIAAGRLRTSAFPLIGRWNAVLDFGTTPAFHPDYRPDAGVILATLRDKALSLGCKRLSMESHMGQAISVDAGELGFVENPRIEFRIPLNEEESEIWSRISKHHRRKIRKAGRANLCINQVQSEEDVWSLRSLQNDSQARRQARGEDMRLGRDQPVVEQMTEILNQGLGKLFLATLDGAVVSGALITFYGNRAYYVFGGSSPHGFSLNAPALLFWEMMCDCKSKGGVEFNLGGVPAAGEDPKAHSHGLYRFKAGFGGHSEHRSDLNANLRPLVSFVSGAASTLLRRG